MKNILIPSDFSMTAKGALNYALKLSQNQHASLKVVHVHYPEVSAVEIHASSLFTEGLEFKQKRLKNFVQLPALKDRGDVMTTTMVEQEVLVGFPGETLVGMSKEPDVDMIIMGTTGESGLLEKVFGSISSHVARKAHCPVLLIPNGVDYKPCMNILFATSHHITDQVMMENIFELLNCKNADIHFVHIDQKPDVQYRIADMNIGSNLTGRFHIVNIESTDTMKGINRYAAENDIDLVAIATAHRPFFEDLFHRSLTKQMALTTDLPMLVLHFDD